MTTPSQTWSAQHARLAPISVLERWFLAARTQNFLVKIVKRRYELLYTVELRGIGENALADWQKQAILKDTADQIRPR